MVISSQCTQSLSKTDIAFFFFPQIWSSFSRNVVCPYHPVPATREWKCCGCFPGCKNDQSYEAWCIHRHRKYLAYLGTLYNISWNLGSHFRAVGLNWEWFCPTPHPAPQGMLAMSGDLFWLSLQELERSTLESSGQSPGILLNTLQCIRQLHNKELSGPKSVGQTLRNSAL